MQSTMSAAAVVGAAAGAYLLDRPTAARYLAISPKTMLRFANERRLPVYRMCRKLLFKKTDLERFADRHAVAPKSRRYERS
jgi:excisionase family DNA binding protein